jgi:hypothetical protein
MSRSKSRKRRLNFALIDNNTYLLDSGGTDTVQSLFYRPVLGAGIGLDVDLISPLRD